MSGPVVCRRSPIVHANCDTCGQKPEVIHKPTNSGGACYCGDCCPVCKGASQRRRESDPACFLSKFTHGVCAKCGDNASPVHLPSGYLGRYYEKWLPEVRGEARSEEGMMPLKLALLPIRWTRHRGGLGEPIAYTVEGLPLNENAVISIRPGGWQVVRYTLEEFDQGRIYSSAEEALAALKAWIEGGEKPTKAEE